MPPAQAHLRAGGAESESYNSAFFLCSGLALSGAGSTVVLWANRADAMSHSGSGDGKPGAAVEGMEASSPG